MGQHDLIWDFNNEEGRQSSGWGYSREDNSDDLTQVEESNRKRSSEVVKYYIGCSADEEDPRVSSYYVNWLKSYEKEKE
tara:strand:- start:2196 stop:2432 length:237 start_codon:yes stop_codon:yes gene_type:complete